MFSRFLLVRRSLHTSRVLFAEEAAGAIPSKMRLRFNVPYDTICDKEIDLVNIPGEAGDYGITPGHVPIVSQLRPGVVEIFESKDVEPSRWFVVGGFAVTHPDSTTDISAAEAAKIDDIDADLARRGLDEYRSKMASLQPETPEHAEAQIGAEVHLALCSALGIHGV